MNQKEKKAIKTLIELAEIQVSNRIEKSIEIILDGKFIGCRDCNTEFEVTDLQTVIMLKAANLRIEFLEKMALKYDYGELTIANSVKKDLEILNEILL